MARIFKAQKYKKNAATGKHEATYDKHGNPVLYDKWRGDYVDHKGKRRIIILSKSKPESQKQLDMIETREREIELGLRAAPNATTHALRRKFDDIAGEYVSWGKAKGARGMPWSSHNLKKRLYYLDFWKKQLGLVCLGDILGCLLKAESVLLEHKVFGKRDPSPRTRHAYREALIAFVSWCIKRKYLSENPFEAMTTYNPTPLRIRRAMTRAEIQSLLATVPLHRRMVYETAFMTGYRVGELRSLTVEHIDRVRNGIRLNPADDKGRQARLQTVTEDFIKRLAEYAESGDALEQYRTSFARARKPMRDDIPENPLLYLPVQTSVMIYADLKKAGIPIQTIYGKVDFHACRTAFINLVIESGADIKTIQVMSRHKRAETTLKYYARANPENMQSTAQALADMVFRGKNEEICTKSALRLEDDTTTKNAIPLNERDCVELEMVGRGGFEPP